MTSWPEIVRVAERADAEPIEPPRREFGIDADRAPPVDLDASDPPEEAGPALPPPTGPALPRRIRLFSAGLILAVVASAMIHTGVLAFLLEQIVRPGVEAPSDAVSVEIVLEEPPSPTAGVASRPQVSSIPASPASSEETFVPDEEEVPAAHSRDEPAVEAQEQNAGGSEETAASEPATAEPDDAGVRPMAEPAPSEITSEAENKQKEEPSDPAPEKEATTETDTLALIAPPTVNIPVPTARPEPPKPRREQSTKSTSQAAKREQGGKAASKASSNQRQVATAKKPSPMPRKSPSPSSAGRRGGATAGELQAYTSRLLRHIDRHKRYPRAAERQGISGTVRVAITLDPQGGFLGARIARSSGQPVFDEEALAATRRAIPYPRPPSSYTGGRVTVSLRFEPGR